MPVGGWSTWVIAVLVTLLPTTQSVTGYTATSTKAYLRSLGSGVVGARPIGTKAAHVASAAAAGADSALLFGLVRMPS